MTWLAAILVRRGLSSRLAGILAWAAAIVVALLLVVGVVIAIAHHRASYVAEQRQDAVADHDKDLTIEAANIVMAADRSAAANQTARDATFANSQDQAKEAVNEAQRTRTSPLDAAFGKLR